VISVAQDHFGTGCQNLVNGQSFDGTLRTYRHEGGTLDGATASCQQATASGAALILV
jgi:hypothetical protein